jgi:TrmH family RNA methyltransferase
VIGTTSVALGERSARVVAARRLLRRVRRDDERKFLAEGPQAVREALGQRGVVEMVFATPVALERYADLAARAAALSVPVLPVTQVAAQGLSETVSPQGLVAVCRFIDVPAADVLGGAPSLVVVLANVRDPGNAGTVLRTADAVGAAAVLFTDAGVDPYNGKCVRASAGSLFHPAVVRRIPVAEAVARCRSAGLRVLAADGSGDTDLFDIEPDLAVPTAWLFGNEAHGLPAEVIATADRRVRVPLLGRAESLNLAAAAAVCLYASARAQRGGE